MTTTKKLRGATKGKARGLTPEQDEAIRAAVETASKAAHPLAAEAYVSTYKLFLNNPGALQVGHRVVEIYNSWLKRKRGRKYADGAYYFATRVDAVMEAGEGVLLDINSDYFLSFFVKAATEVGPEDYHYRKLLDLVKGVDAGAADLNALYDEGKREERERADPANAPELSQPEPEDKTSRDWRIWKLRQIEYGFTSGNSEAYAASWDFYRELLTGLVEDESFFHVSFARTLLPHLITARQEIDGWEDVTPPRPKGRKGKAAKKGAAGK
ncbi:MAG: hypothetical protein ACJ754_01735 [Pyrinomonadaceae bacterium]